MRKILIIDDEKDFIDMIRLRLESSGYNVIWALTGKLGLEKVKHESPCAVLLDLILPEMDGLEVLREIRKENKKLPVFICTVLPDDRLIDQAKKLGASGYITKTGDLKKEIGNIISLLELKK